MPNIRPSSDLRNNYNEISEFCHKNEEPVFITKNGKGDVAVLSIDMYERLCGKYELYRLIEEGLNDIKSGRSVDATEALDEIEKELKL